MINEKRYMLPANLGQLKGMADAFLLAVEAATENGLLTKTFQFNAAMPDASLPHLTEVLWSEITRQTETQLLEKETKQCCQLSLPLSVI